MLAKFRQYSQNLPRPFPFPKRNPFPLPLKAFQGKGTQTGLAFEWVDSIKQLRQVQQFRANQFGDEFGIRFDQDLDQDFYDFDCEHAVVRDKWSGEVVAYTRVKQFQGFNVDQSYSAQEFVISPQLRQLENIVEVGRTCVHPQFRSGKALSLLWLNLAPRVLWGMRAKHLIGCVSVRLNDNLARAYHTHQYIQQLDDSQIIEVPSLNAFTPIQPNHNFRQDQRVPKLFSAYLNMQAQLSREAYHDEAFNCLDYFVYLPVNNAAKTFVMNKMIQK